MTKHVRFPITKMWGSKIMNSWQCFSITYNGSHFSDVHKHVMYFYTLKQKGGHLISMGKSK